MASAMTAVWRRYALVGVLVAVAQLLMPVGPGRDVVYALVGVSGLVAIVWGVRSSAPACPRAWHLVAAAMACWIGGDLLSSSTDALAVSEPFGTLLQSVRVGAYPLLAAALLLFARSRGRDRRPTANLDSAILAIGLGLVIWVNVVEPTWADVGIPVRFRLTHTACLLGNVLLFGGLVRLAEAPGPGRTGIRILSMLFAVALAAGILIERSTLPDIPSASLDTGWLVACVVAGAAALHPSMGRLSAPAVGGDEAMHPGRLYTLTGSLLLGPAVLCGELLTGAPLHAGAVATTSVVLVILVVLRMVRMMRQVQVQTERLGQLADTDYVTGLANRRKFTDRLDDLLSDPLGPSGGLLLIDLERFSEINDTLGNRAGDAILQAIGDRLGAASGEGAVVARVGDGTFAVLAPSITTGQHADDVAMRIRTALEEDLALPDLSVSVEVSVGILLLSEDGAEPALAMNRVDVALSAAKKRPWRTARYGAELETGGTLTPLLMGELSAALANGDIVLHYQPQVELGSGRVLGVEALARWQHPRHGLLDPDAFIPAAEQIGLIVPFTRYVLDAALRQCAAWRRAGLELTVAVNLSARNLLDPGLVDDVRAALDRHGVGAWELELEITESSAMVDPRRSLQVLGELAAMGVMISVDDYGTGRSSLTYLQRLPVGRLKIDGSFVTGLLTDEASAAIVRSTIELARHLHLDVIAEGVEDDATALRLRDMHCFAAQGFALGRPVAAPLIPELIARIERRLPELLSPPRADGVRPEREAAHS